MREEEIQGGPAVSVNARAPGNYDVDALSDAVGVDCSVDGAGLAVQEMKDEADINTIVRMFGITGQLPQGSRPPTYGDFAMVGDYQTALELIEAADASFMLLPADVRSSFQNDAAAFVAFADDPANRGQLEKWGLTESPVVPGAAAVAPSDASDGLTPTPKAQ